MIRECQEAHVIIDEMKIRHCRSVGRKPPEVLPHGATEDELCRRRTAQELKERHDIVMPDAQGHRPS